MMRRIVCFAVLALAACSKPWPVDTPPPAVQAAPADLKHIAVYVHQLVDPPENEQDKWDYENMPGYTEQLRRAFIEQLQRAGYTVVADRKMPHDLHALIQAEWPSDRSGVATLVLTASGVKVATLSASIPIIGDPPRTEHLEGDAAVTLVDAMSVSPDLFAFGHKLTADRAARGQHSPQTVAE